MPKTFQLDDRFACMGELLEQAQLRLDRARRSILRRLGWRRPPGSRSVADDIPPGARPHYDHLGRAGHVVWGVLAQANEALLRGKWIDDLPATAVWGAPGAFDDHPGDLMQIAARLGSLKNRPVLDPDLWFASEVMSNERKLAASVPLPASVCGPTPAWAGRIIVHTMRLPGQRLRSMLLPLVVAPESTPVAMILPEACWPEPLRENPDAVERVAATQVRPAACFSLPEPLEERASIPRAPGAPPRIELTDAALKAIRSLAPDVRRPVLVLRATPGAGFEMKVTENPDAELRTLASGQLPVAYLPAEADELDRVRVEWEESPFGSGFNVWRPVA